jgi:diacylglycerol kinase
MSSERAAVPARIVRAIGISINGLRTAVRLEEAFRLELLVLILVIPAAWILTSVVGRGVLLDLIGGNRVAGHFFLRVVGYP